MTSLDRRTFLRGLVYGLLGAVLGWEIEAIAATEAALPEEEQTPCDTCIGLVCPMCANYDLYLYADPNRSQPGLDAVRRAGDMRPWEGTAVWPFRPNDDPLHQLYHDFAVENARIIDREVMSFIMSLQGDKE